MLLNAAAGMASFDLANDPELLREPFVERMRARLVTVADVVDSGAAIAKLDEWVAATAS